MRITFIRPNMIEGKARDAMEPLVFAILAKLTPADIEIKLYDEKVEPILFEEETDLVAMTVDTFSARRAYQIASYYRRRKIPVIMGGIHPTLCADEVLNYADAIVIGEAENVWTQIILDAKSNTLQRIYKGGYPSLDNLQIDRTIYGKRKYGPIHIIQFGRGCIHDCEFCSVHAFYGKEVRRRPFKAVIDEIVKSDKKIFFFVDDNLFSAINTAEIFCQLLKPLGIKWGCQISLDMANNPELVEKMADAGCIMAVIGFETMNEANLLQMNKKWNRDNSYFEKLIQIFRINGIMIYGSFIFGYDADTSDTVKFCLEFAIKYKFAITSFNLLMPFPGTKLYERLKNDQRLLNDPWWLNPCYKFGDATFIPKNMTVQQLEQSCYQARKDFNSFTNIFSRLFDWHSNSNNLGIFLAFNLANKFELLRKQGIQLGLRTNLQR